MHEGRRTRGRGSGLPGSGLPVGSGVGQATWGGLLGLSLVTQSPGPGAPRLEAQLITLRAKWESSGTYQAVLYDRDKHRKHGARCPTADDLRPLGAVDVTDVDMLVSVCIDVFENAEVSSKSGMKQHITQ